MLNDVPCGLLDEAITVTDLLERLKTEHRTGKQNM